MIIGMCMLFLQSRARNW